jgi:glycosyltransferase involved in cell wall biosynthesis
MWSFFKKKISRKVKYFFCNEINRGRLMMSLYKLKKKPVIIPTYLPSSWPFDEYDNKKRKELLKGFYEDVSKARLIMHSGFFSDLRCSKETLEAIKLLPENYFLVVTGFAKNNEKFQRYDKIIKSLNIEERIISLSYLDFNELLRIYSVCDIGLLLYKNDGFGNYFQAPGRLTEFLGNGLRIVTSNYTGLENICLKYKVGIAVNSDSPTEIAKAIIKLTDISWEELNRDRKRIRDIFNRNFTYDEGGKKIEEIIKSMS